MAFENGGNAAEVLEAIGSTSLGDRGALVARVHAMNLALAVRQGVVDQVRADELMSMTDETARAAALTPVMEDVSFCGRTWQS